MADSVGQIGLDLVVNKNDFNKQMGGIQSLAKKVGATLAAAFAVKKIVDFGKSCIDLGSDLAEVQNVVDVTFPNMSKKIDDFAKNAIKSFGLSETMAKQYSGLYGAMAKAFGFAEGQAYDMATTLAGLAGDVASFYNIDQDLAYTKLKSVFSGETETLKDLGIVMTQNALDAYALANGYGKVTAKMSEAEKVTLRYMFVQDQLAAATGDFVRTSGGWANQVRVLSLQFNSLKATIGQGLINLFTPILKVVNTLIAKLATLASAFKAFTELITGNKASEGISGVGSSAGAAAADLSGATDAANALGDATADAGKAAKKAAKEMQGLSGIDKLNNLSTSDSSGSGGTGSAGAGTAIDYGNMATGENVVDKLDKKFAAMFENIRVEVQPTLDSLKRLWNEGLSKFGDFAWTALKDFYSDFLVPVGSWVLGEGLPRLIDALNDGLKKINWDKLNTSLKDFWQAIGPYAEQFGEGLIDFFEDISGLAVDAINVFPGVLNAFTDVINKSNPKKARDLGYALAGLATSLALFKGLKKPIELLTTFFAGFAGIKSINLAELFVFKLGGAGTPAFDVIGSEILDAISDAIKQLIPQWAFDLLSNLGAGIVLGAVAGSWFPGAGTVAGAIIGGITGAFAGIKIDGKSILSHIASAIFNWDTTSYLFSQAKERFEEAFRIDDWFGIGANIVEGIADGILGAITFLVEPIADLCEALVNGVKELLGIHSPSTVFAEIGECLMSGLLQGAKKKFEDVKKFFTELPGKIKSAFGDVSSWFKEKFDGAFIKVKNAFSGAKDYFSGIWTNIKAAFGNIPDWFKTKFTEAWTKVKEVFSKGGKIFDGIKDGILSGLKEVINGLIGGINKVIEKPFNGLNSALKKIKSVEIAGFKPFDKLISTIDIPKIPKLASGGYVKANTPQLAMIGDNRHQGEVVAPEGKLKDLLNEATKSSQNTDLSVLIGLLKQIIQLLKAIYGKEYQAFIKSDEVMKAVLSEYKKLKGATGKPVFN